MSRPRNSPGTTFTGPLYTKRKTASGATEYVAEVQGGNPRSRCDEVYDFVGPNRLFVDGALFANATSDGANKIVVTAASVSRVKLRAPRSGTLLAVRLVAEDTLATSDTNYVTFEVVNKGAGASTTAMLAVSDANTTKATGGSAITADTDRALTVHATATNVVVVQGDIIEIKATVTGTLANAVDCPRVQLEFATLPAPFLERISRVAGFPTAQVGTTTANGAAAFGCSGTNEAQYSGFDMGDYITVVANKAFMFEARVILNTLPTATARFVCGLASAFNATLDSVVTNAWFRMEGAGSLTALLVESDDGTTDTDDQACVPAQTMVAGSTYVFRIDGRDTASVKFYLDDQLVGSTSMAAIGNSRLQPLILAQKDSGTGTGTFTVDYVRIGWDRV